MKQPSEHFTLEELTRSVTAKNRRIDNSPSAEVINNLAILAKTVLEPLRKKYGKPIVVSSGYRSEKLNRIVGGSKTSQHVRGQAADITSLTDSQKDNKELFELAKSMVENGEIKVGQLIDEYDYNWVHISIPAGNKLNQVLHLK